MTRAGGAESLRPRSSEKLREHLLSVVEDPFEVGANEPAMQQRSERPAADGVLDIVEDLRSAINGLEGVAVDPKAVGAAGLLVGEGVGRVPAGDDALPADGMPRRRMW